MDPTSGERALNWLPSVPVTDPVIMKFVTNTNEEWESIAKSQVAVDKVRRALHAASRSIRELLTLSGSGVRFGDPEIRLPVQGYLTFLWSTHQLPNDTAPAIDEFNYGGVMIRPIGRLPWQK